jgi:hypothetical protein
MLTNPYYLSVSYFKQERRNRSYKLMVFYSVFGINYWIFMIGIAIAIGKCINIEKNWWLLYRNNLSFINRHQIVSVL